MVKCLWPICRADEMIYREKIGIGCSTRPPSRLLSTWRCQVCAFSYSYRYESPHLIPSNVPEVLVFVKTKIRFDMLIRTMRSCIFSVISFSYFLYILNFLFISTAGRTPCKCEVTEWIKFKKRKKNIYILPDFTVPLLRFTWLVHDISFSVISHHLIVVQLSYN